MSHGTSADHDGGKARRKLKPRRMTEIGRAPVVMKRIKGVGRCADRYYDPKTGRRKPRG